MYKINKATNSIEELKESSFNELGFTERNHLQEWIAKNPESLGEKLLIIQKEYSKFGGTAERLDLLALDKESNLVVIENKLDDSGKDVVGQAIKYAAYCSTNTTEQIIEIHQLYLDSNSPGEDAKSSIMEFLQTEDEDELILSENEVRIILIANKYRPEATSTVLWLRKQGHKIKCFKATPIVFEEHEFLNIEQIIPQPDTQGYMISLYEKENENKKNYEKKKLYHKFWSNFKNEFSNRGHQHLENFQVQSRPSYRFKIEKASFRFLILNNECRVELNLEDEDDKSFFEAIKEHKNQIQNSFGGLEELEEIKWEKDVGKRSSSIRIVKKFEESWEDTEERWAPYFEWYINSFVKFHEAIFPVWKEIQSSKK
jgi:hypothetical protein